ncbi:hypothetical protein UA08_07284 [Talaromyces atroroseus]|uniref:Oxidoreductase AflY n=1 Tax=Talaromyces atroroseus TaxID=1441469 RepID=A0A225AWF5_TALAT|nr:hypothetical protein UA08_07284 [Talaromyces atroroseus]OKL57827.1 hypothetical protein UA08_07284 [Talaromyces atroroseus]
MASLLSSIFPSRSNYSIRVPSAKTHDLENAVEKPARSLKHLLKLNHLNNSLWVGGTSHNNVAHHLTSAFLFGADDAVLNQIYEVESKSLDPWKEAPGEVVGSDWMDYLGKKEYERAFLDFFEDNLVDEGYDWKSVVQKFLFSDNQPLFSSITAGLGQPLIHLALAFQMSSRDLAMEALTLVATRYHDNNVAKYSDVAAYFQAEPSYKSSSILEILERVRADQTLKTTVLGTPREQNLSNIFRDHEATLLNHCNAWTIISQDPTATFRDSQAAAVALFLGAKINRSKPDNANSRKHDICLLYPLLMSHAIRIILPQTPNNFIISLLKQWWLTTLAIYVARLRPEIELSKPVVAYDLHDKDWRWVAQQAVKGPHANDTHFVLTLRVLKELGQTWDDPENYYLKAAVKFVHEFNGWDIFA